MWHSSQCKISIVVSSVVDPAALLPDSLLPVEKVCVGIWVHGTSSGRTSTRPQGAL